MATAVFEKITKNKKIFMEMSTFSVPISTKSLLYSLKPILSLSFEFRNSETYGCETHGVHTVRT